MLCACAVLASVTSDQLNNCNDKNEGSFSKVCSPQGYCIKKYFENHLMALWKNHGKRLLCCRHSKPALRIDHLFLVAHRRPAKQRFASCIWLYFLSSVSSSPFLLLFVLLSLLLLLLLLLLLMLLLLLL